jgi:phosphoserine phosphatase
MKKLIVFDVDGVLIDTDKGSFKELGLMFGKEKKIQEHHKEYEKRKHLGPWGLEELAMIFKDLKESDLNKASKEILDKRLMKGINETIKELKNRDYTIVSYSSSPFWIMKALKEKFGFVDICGNIIEVKNGKITGKLLKKIDRHGKAERLKEFMKEKGFTKENTYIIGDSVTDLPMAEYGHFIAFNSKKELIKEKAEEVIDKKDLREILRYLK